MAEKLRVGIIGANVSRGWSPRAHLPALLALPEFELAAVCTAHEETARESAAKFGAGMAFHDHREMLAHADIDIVCVSVRVPIHHRPTMDALEAGRHVYTEWPLGANLAEAEEMAGLAREKGVRTLVGLQSRCAPEYLWLKELVGDGYVGEVLSVRLNQFGSGLLSKTSERTWQRDNSLGATTLTISSGHVIDALCFCLGEFKEVSAVVETRVKQWPETDTGLILDVTAPDNVMVNGTLESGAVVSIHVASIPWHGSGFRLEVYGTDGTLALGASEHPHLDGTVVLGGKSADSGLAELPVPDRLTWVPDGVPAGPPFNVAQMWRRFGEAIRSGDSVEPDFDSAVRRHRLLDAIERASDTGEKQSL